MNTSEAETPIAMPIAVPIGKAFYLSISKNF
jgi:hypothetical protein